MNEPGLGWKKKNGVLTVIRHLASASWPNASDDAHADTCGFSISTLFMSQGMLK